MWSDIPIPMSSLYCFFSSYTYSVSSLILMIEITEKPFPLLVCCTCLISQQGNNVHVLQTVWINTEHLICQNFCMVGQAGAGSAKSELAGLCCTGPVRLLRHPDKVNICVHFFLDVLLHGTWRGNASSYSSGGHLRQRPNFWCDLTWNSQCSATWGDSQQSPWAMGHNTCSIIFPTSFPSGG